MWSGIPQPGGVPPPPLPPGSVTTQAPVLWGATTTTTTTTASTSSTNDTAGQKHDIFVGNLAFATTEEQLHSAFSDLGRIIKVRMVTDLETGKPRGFAFIEFEDPQAALSAIRNMNDYELNGRRIRVNFSNSSHLETLAGKLGMDMTSSSTNNNNNNASSSTTAPNTTNTTNTSNLINSTNTSTINNNPMLGVGSGGVGGLGASTSSLLSGSGTKSNTQAVADALKNMTKAEMYDVIARLKEISDTNVEEARKLLCTHPQLPEAILHLMSKLDMIQSTPSPVTSLLTPPTATLTTTTTTTKPPPPPPPVMAVPPPPHPSTTAPPTATTTTTTTTTPSSSTSNSRMADPRAAMLQSRPADPRAAARVADPRSAASAAAAAASVPPPAVVVTRPPPPPPVVVAPPPPIPLPVPPPPPPPPPPNNTSSSSSTPTPAGGGGLGALDPALVQQVLSLTPQQISQLPPDKQASILALRQQITGGAPLL